MQFFQEFYLGFTRLMPQANMGVYKHVSERLRVRQSRVDSASGYLGSYHVLEMGRHYSEYVRYKGEFPPFRRVTGFPLSHYLGQLDTKSRASNVTGNIGEIVAGIVARRTLKFDSPGIAHLKTSNNAQTPDYLLRRTAEFEDGLNEIIPALAGATLPLWWPMESKARAKGIRAGVREALEQLAAYWYHTRYSVPQGIGYGIIIGTEFQNPRRVCIHVFTPADQPSLLVHLKSFIDYSSYRASLKSDLLSTGRYLTNYA